MTKKTQQDNKTPKQNKTIPKKEQKNTPTQNKRENKAKPKLKHQTRFICFSPLTNV